MLCNYRDEHNDPRSASDAAEETEVVLADTWTPDLRPPLLRRSTTHTLDSINAVFWNVLLCWHFVGQRSGCLKRGEIPR